MFQNKKISLALFCLVIFFSACQKDDTTNPSTGGTALDRDKFLGTWITQSNGTSGQLNFTMNISAGASDPSQIKIENFDLEGSGTFIFGYVSGSSVSIPEGHDNIIAGDTIYGSGMYNTNNTLTFNYSIRRNSVIDSRSASAHK